MSKGVIAEEAKETGGIITAEDHSCFGCLGSAVNVVILVQGSMVRLVKKLSSRIEVLVLSSPRSGIRRSQKLLTHKDNSLS